MALYVRTGVDAWSASRRWRAGRTAQRAVLAPRPGAASQELLRDARRRGQPLCVVGTSCRGVRSGGCLDGVFLRYPSGDVSAAFASVFTAASFVGSVRGTGDRAPGLLSSRVSTSDGVWGPYYGGGFNK